MPLIKILPDILASQVAAGEVVERPASVVKELVENSIDAGAKEIMVDIENGGISLIRVTDDGCGMEREDALLSLERHATSKLSSADDLAKVMTLGFRGEAVPSIASVAKFRMTTRRPENISGTEIIVDGGKLRDVRDAGGAPGTVIEARNLFFNMPARRKFMRAESTESAHVEQQLRLHALASPHVRFRFRKDDRLIFDFPAVPKALDRVRQLVGNDLGTELLEVPESLAPGMAVSGFILPAKHARKGRKHQFVFLNGRPIEDNAISKGLSDGFRGNLLDGFHPAAWLWLDVEPQLVDVNVHPAKKEVRFHRPFEIRDLISNAVSQALKPKPQPTESPNKITPERPHTLRFHPSQPELPSAPPPSEQPSEPPQIRAPKFRLIGLLQDRYVLLESNDGLVLFDPKAAQERILFEKFAKAKNDGLETQNLLVPILIELDPRDLDIVLREKMALLDAGLEVEAFGGNTLQLRSLPAFLNTENPKTFLDEILTETLHGPSSAGKFTFDRLARIIAKEASKHVTARLAEVPAILDELFHCDLPYCAADGRPTLTEFSRKDIDRRFGLGRS